MDELIGTVNISGMIPWIKEFRSITGSGLVEGKKMFELLTARGYRLSGNSDSLLVAAVLQSRWCNLTGVGNYKEVLELALEVVNVQQDADLDQALTEMTLGNLDLARGIDFAVNEEDMVTKGSLDVTIYE
jgi:hypothetical protein